MNVTLMPRASAVSFMHCFMRTCRSAMSRTSAKRMFISCWPRPHSPLEVSTGMAERVRSRFGVMEPRFGLYFNCLARGTALYGEEGVDARLLSEALPGVPLVGFHCNAELAPINGVNRLLTYTGVLVVVGE